MHARQIEVLKLLADGCFHSGESIGQALGVSRAAVWKILKTLQQHGIEVFAVSGKGYKLRQPYEPLDRSRILQQLDPGHGFSLELIQQLESTNTYLMSAAQNGAASRHVVMAEQQTKGRGRRGRTWVSPFGRNIYLSLLWRFEHGTVQLGGLSLAVAVALMRAANELGLERAGIKWPNDILVEGRKLAGILIDVAGESNGPCFAVIGLGINHDMPAEHGGFIDQAWTDIRREGIQHDRNEVVVTVLRHLHDVLVEYAASGFSLFIPEWSKWDLTADSQVAVHQGGQVNVGVARGIDAQGMLLLEHEGIISRCAAGEVSLRGCSA